MAIISINNQLVEKNLTHDSTVNDVINSVISEVAEKQGIITSIKLDGNEIEYDRSPNVLVSPIGDHNKIDFTVQSSIELALEALDSCSRYIDIIVAKIHKLTDYYNNNQLNAAHAQFAEVIEIIDLFVQLMSKINNTLRQNAPDTFTKTPLIKNLEIHLLSILKALVPAKEKEDIIMLCDLLEYELVDNLTQWKIKAIPELKSIRNN
jgi:hypothetical protein